jgi:predicted phage-related endonuclease
MQTHELVQGDANWHAYRRSSRNASDAAAMLGCSPYMTRTQLLQAMHTGIRPEPTPDQQRRFDKGHEIEAAKRAVAEAIIGEDLYPVVGSAEVDGIELSASFDGLTMLEDTNWECKSLNAELRAALPYTGDPAHNQASQLPKAYRVQLEQQCAVSGCTRVLFTASDGQDDDRHCWYYPDPALRAEITAGWKQFAIDLAAYVPVEVLDRPAPVGHSPDQLPALRSSVKGELVLESNIKEWEEAALAYIKSVRDHDLKTDEDFANADAAAKWCDASKTSLEGVRAQLMGATGDVNLAVGTLDRIMGELDKTRIAFNNAIKARKEARKGEIVAGGIAAFREHIAGLNTRLGKAYMPNIPADFAGAIKGKSSLAKMEDAVANTLATLKIESNRIADGIDLNLRYLREHAKDHTALFPDTGAIVLKAHDDLVALAQNRINEHKAAEEKRLEAERERIRKEEQDKLQREQEARERETARQAAQLATPAPEVLWNGPRNPDGSCAPIGSAGLTAAAAPNVVVPMRAAPVIESTATISLGQINERLAPIQLTADGLATLGFQPCGKERSAVMYREADFQRMCDSIVAHVRMAQQTKQAA